MKNKATVMAGLISCATMLFAQEAAIQFPNNTGIRNLVTQVTHPSLLWTNNVSLYSVVGPSFIKAEDSSEHTAAAGTSLFDNLAGSEVPFWIQAAVSIHGGARTENGTQIIVVESESEMTDCIRIPEHGYFIPPQTAWYEWINPRVFIPKWTEFWMTESDATPVVLVMIAF